MKKVITGIEKNLLKSVKGGAPKMAAGNCTGLTYYWGC